MTDYYTDLIRFEIIKETENFFTAQAEKKRSPTMLSEGGMG